MARKRRMAKSLSKTSLVFHHSSCNGGDAYFTYNNYIFNKNAIETDGVVINKQQNSMLYGRPYGGSRNAYTLISVKFHDAKGDLVIMNSTDSSLQVNDQVKVRYNPENPQEAVISK